MNNKKTMLDDKINKGFPVIAELMCVVVGLECTESDSKKLIIL
jgi:hypothetical protein